MEEKRDSRTYQPTYRNYNPEYLDQWTEFLQ